jgi:hypothetical protein
MVVQLIQFLHEVPYTETYVSWYACSKHKKKKITKKVKMFRKTKFHFIQAAGACWGKPGWSLVLRWRHCRKKNYLIALHTQRAYLQRQHKTQRTARNCIHIRKLYLICKTDRAENFNFVNWYLRGKHKRETDTTIVLPGGAVLFHLGAFVNCHNNRFPS